MGWLGIALVVLIQLVALVMIPLGLPGTLVQVAVVIAVTILSDGTWLSWSLVGWFVVLAALAEGVDVLAGMWGARRFGGGSRAAWGALIGGLLGAFLGNIPVPVVGAVIASFIGTFIGAIVGEMSARGETAPDLRVGMGAVVGRALSVAFKLGVGCLIFILSVWTMVAHARG
jgi:hypothetical protein